MHDQVNATHSPRGGSGYSERVECTRVFVDLYGVIQGADRPSGTPETGVK